MLKYDIVCENTPEKMFETVNSYLGDGWHLIGGVAAVPPSDHSSFALFQAIGREVIAEPAETVPVEDTESDEYLLAAVLTAGIAKWEPFPSGNRGELCMRGLRYTCDGDENGVPLLYDSLRRFIRAELRKLWESNRNPRKGSNGD